MLFQKAKQWNPNQNNRGNSTVQKTVRFDDTTKTTPSGNQNNNVMNLIDINPSSDTTNTLEPTTDMMNPTLNESTLDSDTTTSDDDE